MKQVVIKIRFEGLTCQLCKHMDDFIVLRKVNVFSLSPRQKIDKDNSELKEIMVKMINKYKAQNNVMCRKCGAKKELDSARRINWDLFGDAEGR